MNHSKRHYKFSTLSNIISYFQSFTDFLRELNDREIENHYKMNSEKVETWHGIIISPTWHVQKSRGLRQKLDTLRVQTGQSGWEYQGFGRELICYTTLHFLNLFELQTFFCVPMHHSKRRHQFSTLSNIICYFSVIYRFV